MGVFNPETGEARDYSEEEAAAIAATPGTVDQVEAERARRLACGFNYDFGGERGIHRIGTTEKDRKGWDEVTTISNAAIATGDPDRLIEIKTDTATTSVSAIEWQEVLLEAAAFRQPIWQASFALLAMDPIPGDFADDLGTGRRRRPDPAV
jgi:hypothetical protein